MRHYCLFGLVLASDFPFATRLAEASPTAVADLVFRVHPPEPPAALESAATLYTSPLRRTDGAPVCLLLDTGEHEILRFPGLADFVLAPGAIDCRPFEANQERLLEIRLFGAVLAYHLERLEIPMLHASAVTLAGRAVAFLARNAGGKTGLAAALSRMGHPLLSDDLLPVVQSTDGFLARPGYPQMRMWPDEASFFLGPEHAERLDRVHPDETKRRVPVGPDGLGSADLEPRPLARIFLPRRTTDELAPGELLTISPLRPREAVLELVRGTFSPFIVEAVGWQPRRLATLAGLVETVRVEHLLYRDGFEHLQDVAEVLAQHLEADLAIPIETPGG